MVCARQFKIHKNCSNRHVLVPYSISLVVVCKKDSQEVMTSGLFSREYLFGSRARNSRENSILVTRQELITYVELNQNRQVRARPIMSEVCSMDYYIGHVVAGHG